MNYSEGVISSARAILEVCTNVNAQGQLFILAMRAILLAANTGLHTASISVSGATSQNLQELLETLHLAGYTTSITTTTLTINW